VTAHAPEKQNNRRDIEMLNRRTLVAAMAAATFVAAGPGTAPMAAADELADLKEKGVIRIAMSGAYPPFNFVNEQNEVVGFDPSIGQEIAKRMGLEAEIVTTAWDGIIGGLLANKYDAIVGSMSITEERDEVVDFVGPYYTTKRAIFTKPDSGITSVSQLDDAQVGVTLGETHEEWARDQGYSIRTYKGLPELLLELDNGRVDVIVNDSIAAILAMKETGQDYVMLEDLETDVIGAGIAIREGNPELQAEMQAALDAMMEDGTYLEIAEKWVGGDIR
jgi:polar amino acid transport system substrate-binding protein